MAQPMTPRPARRWTAAQRNWRELRRFVATWERTSVNFYEKFLKDGNAADSARHLYAADLCQSIQREMSRLSRARRSR